MPADAPDPPAGWKDELSDAEYADVLNALPDNRDPHDNGQPWWFPPDFVVKDLPPPGMGTGTDESAPLPPSPNRP